MTRRNALVGGVAAWLAVIAPAQAAAAAPGARAEGAGAPPLPPWWYAYPSLVQGEEPAALLASGAAVAIHGMGSDPTWGPYAQRLRVLESGEAYRAVRTGGMRVICWVEGFGDCMLYAAAFERAPGGGWKVRSDDPSMAAVVRSHWNWADPGALPGSDLRWVGVHNLVNSEDFSAAAAERGGWTVPAPRYPDGKLAVGWIAGGVYPLNARVYDACGSKSVDGRLDPCMEFTPGVPATGGPMPGGRSLRDGLLVAIPGTDDAAPPPGHRAGDPVHCGVVSVHKDLSAPFWRDYARRSIRTILRAGVDGLWCDNYSPWDNFGYWPVRRAFGDWSVYRFQNEYVPALPQADRERLGAAETGRFDVRRAMLERAAAFGAKAPIRLDDPAWHDARWLDDPVWCAYRAFRQARAHVDMRAFYETIHEEARAAGRPDFCIGGNDIPFYGLGWTRDAWLDMVNTELTPGWHMGAGSRGVMIPPAGKMAVVYNAALEHQKGPFSAAWYYLDGAYANRQRKPVIGALLQAEAFANGAALLCDPGNPRVSGTVESHARWNAFVRANQAAFGDRTRIADAGILFSPDNQLALLTPGGFPDMDRQPHMFGHWGWAAAMVDAHVPYRAIADWNVRDEALRSLRVLVLPSMECVEDAALGHLRRFVERGGRLVVSGECAVRRGPAGRFAPRGGSWLSRAVAQSLASGPQPLGRGVVVALTGTPGMDYWLRAADRARLLAPLRDAVGPAGDLDAAELPTTVGAFPWRGAGPDGPVFVDLVNYALHPERDEVAPAGPLKFHVRVPAGWGDVTVSALSPDPCAATARRLADGRVELRVDHVAIYGSVRIARKPGPGAAA